MLIVFQYLCRSFLARHFHFGLTISVNICLGEIARLINIAFSQNLALYCTLLTEEEQEELSQLRNPQEAKKHDSNAIEKGTR